MRQHTHTQTHTHTHMHIHKHTTIHTNTYAKKTKTKVNSLTIGTTAISEREWQCTSTLFVGSLSYRGSYKITIACLCQVVHSLSIVCLSMPLSVCLSVCLCLLVCLSISLAFFSGMVYYFFLIFYTMVDNWNI